MKKKSMMKAKGIASADPQARMAKTAKKPMSEDFKPSRKKSMPAGMMKAKGRMPASPSAREKRLKDMPL